MLSSPRPNLFIIGAMKSGTSSLHSYLGAHPSIFMSFPKEPSYFVARAQLRSIWPQMEKRGYWKAEENYLELFRKAGDARIIGEASTNYSKLPRITGVAERIARFNPEARIIYIMRDPVERTISHYWHMAALHSEAREILPAIRQDRHYREVSHYALQLAPYLKLFGAANLRTLTFEALKSSPLAVAHDIFAWLGVDPTFVPPNIGHRANVTPKAVLQARGVGVLRQFRYSRVWDILGPVIPAGIRAAGRNLSEKTVNRSSVELDEVITLLRGPQRDQTEELSAMLGRDFREWKTLYGSS
ncbi:MAG: sulfotransferase [Sphingomonadales bacterium]